MMDFSHETFVFFEACIIGALFGAVYDAFRIIRLSFKNPKVLIFFEDVAYFVFLSIASFIFIVVENNGVLRGFLVFGELIGMILYFFTISIFIMKSANIIIKCVKTILTFIYNITLKKIIQCIRFVMAKLVDNIRNSKIKIKLKPTKCKLHLK